MLYNLENRLKRSYVNLPLGLRRLWIATSIAWLAGFFLLNLGDFTLLWQGALATPRTTCAQVYDDNDGRKHECEFAAAPYGEDINFYMQGKSHSFDPYFEKYRRDDKLLIWLGTPVAWLGLILAFMWVRRGFEVDRVK